MFITKITMLINLVVGAQNSLFLDLSATLNIAYWWLLECHLIWFLRGHTLWFFPISLHGSSSSHCSPNVGVSQGSVFASLLYPYLFLGDFMALNAICVLILPKVMSSSWIFLLNFRPMYPTAYSTSLHEYMLAISDTACQIWISDVSESFPHPS